MRISRAPLELPYSLPQLDSPGLLDASTRPHGRSLEELGDVQVQVQTVVAMD